jgi:hypothetical protein
MKDPFGPFLFYNIKRKTQDAKGSFVGSQDDTGEMATKGSLRYTRPIYYIWSGFGRDDGSGQDDNISLFRMIKLKKPPSKNGLLY